MATENKQYDPKTADLFTQSYQSTWPEARQQQPPADILISSRAPGIATHSLLTIAHRLLAEHPTELQAVEIVRENFGFGGRSLRVVLSREKDGKLAEVWGWTT